MVFTYVLFTHMHACMHAHIHMHTHKHKKKQKKKLSSCHQDCHANQEKYWDTWALDSSLKFATLNNQVPIESC